MKTPRMLFLYFATVLVSLLMAGAAQAHVPVRISIKFILNASGNRPATGSLNTDAEINAEFNAALSILNGLNSEFTIDRIEFVDIAGASESYGTTSDNAGIALVKSRAQASPAAYLWRDNAINIYINGGSSSAISYYPPNNDMILMNQNCGNTPSCILHEMGHSLNLAHTHDNDGCSDTIPDNQNWTKDQLSNNSYGCNYAACTAGQKAAVDMVYNNVMSYHADEPQLLLSPCQMNRFSAQGETDRGWMLAKWPVYVDSGRGGSAGTFASPYSNLQAALAAGGLANRVLVLQQGAYSMSQHLINASGLEIVTRSGPSSFTYAPGVLLYKLPVDLENSSNPGVRSAISSVQDEDKAERNIEKAALSAEKNAVRAEEMAVIRADAATRRKVHQDNALKGLLEAEKSAEKDEKLAVQMELAERYKYAGDYNKAILYYNKVAVGTDQPNLKKVALIQAEKCLKSKTETPGKPVRKPTGKELKQ